MIKNKGFTLIELLVAILIVAVLSTIGMIGYRSAINKNNDAKKIEDMKTIQKALEQYYSVEGQYRGSCLSAGDSLTTTDGTMILQEFPSSPDSTSYASSDCTSTTYCYCAALETGDGNSSDSSCSYGTADGYYCVDARQ